MPLDWVTLLDNVIIIQNTQLERHMSPRIRLTSPSLGNIEDNHSSVFTAFWNRQKLLLTRVRAHHLKAHARSFVLKQLFTLTYTEVQLLDGFLITFSLQHDAIASTSSSVLLQERGPHHLLGRACVYLHFRGRNFRCCQQTFSPIPCGSTDCAR